MKDKKRGFFSRLFDKLDKKLEDKSKEKPCCCKDPDSKEPCKE